MVKLYDKRNSSEGCDQLYALFSIGPTKLLGEGYG